MIIRKLQEQDKEITINFLSEEASINLFIIGDIEAFGFDEEFQELWGQFNDCNELEGVLLRFNESYIPYWKKDDFNNSEFKNIIQAHKGTIIFSGKETVIKTFDDILPNHLRRITYFCELSNNKNLKVSNEHDIKVASIEDCEKISKFLFEIEEFSNTNSGVDRLKHKLKTNTGKIYFLENETGDIISVTQTTAETSSAAMVVGVATKKDQRKKGLMTACLSKLCSDILEEGKKLCLFFDNPEAGRVYLNLGFKAIDNWIMTSEK